jgi:hypothetical protein
MAGSSNPNNDNDLDPQEYMLLHDRCAICHWPAARPGRWLELHHIIGGAGRKDYAWNFLSCCARCHHYIHHVTTEKGGIPRGAVLAAKLEEDGEIELEKLAALRRRKNLPYEVEPIPQKFRDDRRKRGGDPWP